MITVSTDEICAAIKDIYDDTRSITEPGSYSSGTAMQPAAEWKKSAARIRQLDDMARRLQQLEKRLAAVTSSGDASSDA
ncbi:hypothetical protein OUHCRE3_51940 [Enterobacter hormaechei]